jgi:hypothetical protein
MEIVIHPQQKIVTYQEIHTWYLMALMMKRNMMWFSVDPRLKFLIITGTNTEM